MIVRLLLANLKIMVRDRLSLFWALVFPLIFVGVFGLFNLDEPPEVNLALVDEEPGPFSQALIANLATVEVFDVEPLADREMARRELKDGAYDMALLLPPGLGRDPQASATALYSESNVQINQLALGTLRRFFDEFNLQSSGVAPVVTLAEASLSTRNIGYMDFLVPGILGMGVMTYAIIGIATLLVTYQEKRILRRIQVTPLPVAFFVIAQVGAFLVISLLQTAIILGAGVLAGADLTGNFVWAFPLAAAGNFIFLNIGIMVAAASKTVNAASGMGNAITLPMMFLSGVFFPTDQLPPIMEKLVTYLPLTPLLETLRTVILDNDSILSAGDDLALLGGWAVVTVLLAARVFRLR
ncbi:MAG TPA: ABC transporter permease [Dehalococcoidia bacterium]|nr:ABC transporter permease [Dehalococcoidia bacterium]